MTESEKVSLTLWPAQPLPESVAIELHALGVNLSTFTVEQGRFTARRDRERTVVLELSFVLGVTLPDLEAVLATLRLTGISYVAWDITRGAVTGTARSFDPVTNVEREITVTADGTPVLTARDLEQLEDRYSTAEAVIEGIRDWLRPLVPGGLTELGPDELVIVTVPDEDTDEPVEPHGDVDVDSEGSS